MGGETRKIWDKTRKNFVEMNYLSLNMIDDYNCDMVGVDFIDQL